MATWDSFRVASTDPGHVSLQEIVDLAYEVGGRTHGFRCASHIYGFFGLNQFDFFGLIIQNSRDNPLPL